MAFRPGRYVSLSEAVALLKEGGLLAFPTETFYAVGGSALDAGAVERVYQAKLRQATKPLPVAAGDRGLLGRYVDFTHVPDVLLRRWPGPLTLVLPACPGVFPSKLLDREGRVAVRVTPHPVAAALSIAIDAPLTVSSANIQAHNPARTAADIEEALALACGGILDEGPEPEGGLPSTILEPLPDGSCRVIREGAIPLAALAFDGVDLRHTEESGLLRY